MTQKQIILYIAKWFNLDEILSLKIFGGTIDSIDSNIQKEIDNITSSINLVVDEIACDYFPLLTNEMVMVENNQIIFKNLEKPILKVFALKNGNFNIPYKSYPNYLKVDYNGKLSITYSFAPSAPQSITDSLEIVGANLTSRIIAYGTAREYCLQKMLYDQADYYNSRFTASINNLTTKKSALRLPKRRWI